MHRNPILLLVLACLLPGGVVALDLYTGIVPVASQTEDERLQALPDALIQVLQKLSGRRELPTDPMLDEALDSAAHMMISFQYLESEQLLPDGSNERQLQLAATFLPESVDRLVRTLGLPRWRTERNPVVLWVVVDDGQGRALMPVEYQYAYDRLEAIAALRGLPVAWPGLSEELKAQVDLQLLWGGYTEQLLADGSGAQGVAIVAARREGPEWNVHWTYTDDRATTSWRTRDRELSFALTGGIQQLTELVASVNSIGPAGLGEWQVELLVGGLLSGADYARCLAYLEGLSLVDRVSVLRVGPDGVNFRLALNSEPAYLQRAISMDGVLEAGKAEHEYLLVP